jgi:predicted GNAT family acetyltransferase
MVGVSIDVTDAPERERFEARDSDADQAVAGFMTYQLSGKIIVITHTQVSPEYEGKGVGGLLARFAMNDARAKSRTVVPICPFLAKWLQTHVEYNDLVAPSHQKIK